MALDRQEQMRMMFLQQTAADAPLSRSEASELANLERMHNARVRPSVKVTPKSKAGNDARPSLSQRAKASGELINERRGDKVITQLRREGSDAQQQAETLRDTIKRRVMDRKLSSLKQGDAAVQLQGKDFVRDMQMVSELETEGVLPKGAMKTEDINLRGKAGALVSDTEGLIPGAVIGDIPSQPGNPRKVKAHLRKAQVNGVNQRNLELFRRPDNGRPLIGHVGDGNKNPIPEINIDSRWQDTIPNRFGGRDLVPQYGTRASEIMTRNAAWLSGNDVSFTNDVTPDDFINAQSRYEWDKAYGKITGVDFTNTSGQNVDAEIEIVDGKPSGKNSVQARKGVKPKGSVNNVDLEATIQRQVEARQGNLRLGLDDLENSGDIYRQGYEGKLYKKPKGSTQFSQDVIIKPSVNKTDAGANMQGGAMYLRDKRMMEPISVKEIDLDTVRSQPVTEVKVTGGGSQGQFDRVVHTNIGDDNPAVTDITRRGYTEQMIKDPNYVKPPIKGTVPQGAGKPPRLEAPKLQVNGGLKVNGMARQVLDGAGKLLRNPAVRALGVGLGAVPILGDVADAATGTIDVVTKTGDQQVRGAGNAAAGFTGLAAVAAPAAAPLLAPISGGLAAGNLAADFARDRKQERAIGESSKYERTGAFNHTEDNPVSIGLPGPVQSETQRRRQARRSSTGATPVARPQTGKQWWEQGVDSVMNFFQ